MRGTPAGVALSLTALLLLSIIGSTVANTAPPTVLEDALDAPQNTGARSTSAEVFLTAEVPARTTNFGAIASTDDGWVSPT